MPFLNSISSPSAMATSVKQISRLILRTQSWLAPLSWRLFLRWPRSLVQSRSINILSVLLAFQVPEPLLPVLKSWKGKAKSSPWLPWILIVFLLTAFGIYVWATLGWVTTAIK